eukprot:5181982-Amphidinium_carterae.1
MVRSKWDWVALSHLQDVQLRLSYALLWMQSGCKARRSRAASWDGQEADSLFPLQALGGAGDPLSVAASSGAQEETSCAGDQGATGSRPACEAQSTGPQAHHLSGQATGVACGPAGQSPATPERAGHHPHRAGEAPGGGSASSQEDSDESSRTFTGGPHEVCAGPSQGRRCDCVNAPGGVLGQSRAVQGSSRSPASLDPPRLWRDAGGRGRRNGGRRRTLCQEEERNGGGNAAASHPSCQPVGPAGSCQWQAEGGGRHCCLCRKRWHHSGGGDCWSSCGHGGRNSSCPRAGGGRRRLGVRVEEEGAVMPHGALDKFVTGDAKLEFVRRPGPRPNLRLVFGLGSSPRGVDGFHAPVGPPPGVPALAPCDLALEKKLGGGGLPSEVLEHLCGLWRRHTVIVLEGDFEGQLCRVLTSSPQSPVSPGGETGFLPFYEVPRSTRDFGNIFLAFLGWKEFVESFFLCRSFLLKCLGLLRPLAIGHAPLAGGLAGRTRPARRRKPEFPPVALGWP